VGGYESVSVIIEGLGKRWHCLSSGWDDLPERIGSQPANISVLVSKGLSKCGHGINGGLADLPKRISRSQGI
jgi:hypothetical protein